MNKSLRPLLIVWMCSAALLLVQPFAGALLLALSGYHLRRQYAEAGWRLTAANSLGLHGLSMGLLVFAAFWLMQPPAPADDLLRHIPAYAYGYSHTAMYPHSTLPNFNLYPMFDRVLGAMAQAWGPYVALQVVLAAAWASAMLLAIRLAVMVEGRVTAGGALLLCLLFASTLSERLFLGRPEVFCALWGVSALLCRSRLALTVWCAGAVALSSSYWLFPVYLAFVVLLPVRWATRFGIGASLLAIHVAFWTWHAGSLGEYLNTLRLIPVWTQARLMPVLETTSIWQSFTKPPMLLLALLALTGLSKLERSLRFGLCAVGALFLLTNMARYSAVLALLFFVAALPLAAGISQFVSKHVGAALLVLFLPMLVAGVAREKVTTLTELPHFTLPAGAKVLTAFDEATFAVPFFNPGSVSVVPAMEIGATEKSYQAAAVALSRATLTCAQLAALDITHIVERSQQAVLPCLHLTGVQRDWRMWEVRHVR